VTVVAGVDQRAQTLPVPHHARGAALARRRLIAALREVGVDPELAADAVTVLSELVGNAARHARPLRGGVIRVTWSATPARVELWVTDGGSSESPRLRTSDWDAADGRGLQIVAALAQRWGVEVDGSGHRVWAELAATRSGSQAALGHGADPMGIPVRGNGA
jgi:anti-sigma regulatory factor (Ser/Thr protein kinase)